MKSIYNEYNAMKDEYIDIITTDLMIHVDDIFKECEKKDYNIREVSQWLVLSIYNLSSEYILRNAMQKRKEEKNKSQEDKETIDIENLNSPESLESIFRMKIGVKNNE